MGDEIKFATDGPIAWITIDRPDKLNTITPAMGVKLHDLSRRINDDAAIRVVVLRSVGDRAFSAGSDVRVLDEYGTNWQLRNRQDYCRAIWAIRVPTIASVRGYCIGGGLELAMACDIRVASADASFGAGEVRLGWNGGAGNTQLLPRLVGYGKAMEMALTGDLVPSTEARMDGLVQLVVPDDELETKTNDLAARIAANAPIAAQLCKHLIRMSLNTPLDAGMAWENDLFAYSFTTSDSDEGLAAFLEKRPARFEGR